MAFSDKKIRESLRLGFDLARNLRRGESITGVTFSISVLFGADSNVAAMLSGDALFSGSVAEQLVVNGVADCEYLLEMSATTSRGNVYIERDSFLVVA